MGDVKVQLPPGCSGLTMQDGTNYSSARKGGHVMVDEDHAPYVRRQVGGDAGLVGHASFRAMGIGTKAGRWCASCKRLWNAWSTQCPRCGAATDPA